jgi:hypothetical protein
MSVIFLAFMRVEDLQFITQRYRLKGGGCSFTAVGFLDVEYLLDGGCGGPDRVERFRQSCFLALVEVDEVAFGGVCVKTDGRVDDVGDGFSLGLPFIFGCRLSVSRIREKSP